MCVTPVPPLDASPDSAVDALDCTDPYEPNNNLADAYATGVATSQSTRTLSSAMICPAGDPDYYRLEVVTGNIELIVADAPTGADISGSIMNANGVPITNAIPVADSPYHHRAYLQSVPAGTYYVLVTAVNSTATSPNDVGYYDVTVTVTP